MDTLLDLHLVEGEIGLTVDYAAGKDSAIAVLSGATQMIAALDALDCALLSSVDTELEPVSILNDVQHSSLKILLARALRKVPEPIEVAERVVNRGREWLKVRYPDMLGQAQWTVQRAGRSARVSILHQEWLDAYHRREVHLLPGDALDCSYEEAIEYDDAQNELSRHLAVIAVHGVRSPPKQQQQVLL